MRSPLPVALLLSAVVGCTGADGVSDLTDVKPEPAGSHCAAGGVVITSGADTDGNGMLDDSEVTSTNYVCSGPSGTSGTSTLSTVSSEPAGANCAAGGVKIDNGTDANNDHVLQPSEVTSTTYVCGAGAAQVVKVADPSAVVAANSNTGVTVLHAQITTPGAGKLLGFSNVDAYCAAAECPAGNPAADGYLWLSTVNTETLPAADYEYFFLTPNTTETISRTQDFPIAAAGTYDIYLRGRDGTNSFSFYRPSITLVFLP